VIGSDGSGSLKNSAADHFKDVVQWWIWFGFRTWDEYCIVTFI